MEKTIEVFSSGGLGDSLIVGLKIKQAFQDASVIWRHFEKHPCHSEPCSQIQFQFADHVECRITDSPEKDALQMCGEVGGQYIDTRINKVLHPYLDRHLVSSGLTHQKLAGRNNYIVVQAQAGRMHDGTRREVGVGVMNQLLKTFPHKHLVILGPEWHPFSTTDMERTINLTEQTESILDVFNIINDCALFVGQDGVMAYYSMMIGKPTLVTYHIGSLPNHYWNNQWGTHALAWVGGSNLNELIKHPRLDTFIECVIANKFEERNI
jgi:hypothetical protein